MKWNTPVGMHWFALTIFLADWGLVVAVAPLLNAQVPPAPPVNYDIFVDATSRLDARDLFRVQQLWTGSPNPVDFNRDGKTNRIDLLLFIQSFHSPVSSAPTPTPSDTPSPGELTPTPTPAATPTVGEATPTLFPTFTPAPGEASPTPTPLPGEITPTPTPLPGELTPTPTTGEATPTPTPTLEAPTPTPTREEATATPTSVPGEATPTPTVTPTPVEITPTATTPPVEETPTPTATLPEATPTATFTPAPTATPTRASGTPTPTPAGGLHFYVDFDSANTFDDIPVTPLDEEAADALIAAGRMPAINQVVPWFIFDTQAPNPSGAGTAYSEPKSAAMNPNFGFYYSSQTSVLEIDGTLDTSGAVMPILSFEAAFAFEEPFFDVGDFLVVEVLRSGQSAWEMVDLNNDGQVITDPTVFDQNNPTQPLLPGTFDALYGYSNPQNPGGLLTRADFLFVQLNLPKDPALRIAFRFQSNSSLAAEGIYLDNLRVIDASGGPVEPVIRTVTNLAGTAFYTDTESQALIQGTQLSPAKKIFFKSRDGEVELPFTEQAEGLAVVLPRLSNPAQGDTALLRVVRTDDVSSAEFSLTLNPAPAPVITTISPSPFFLDAAGSVIQILGNHFRPAFEGAPATGGSSVIITTGVGDPLVYNQPAQFISRNLTLLEFNAAALKTLSPGPVEIRVRNEYSGLESASVILSLQSGAGDIVVQGFRIELGFGLFSYDPATETYPLQADQSFTLLWQMSDFTPAQINIDINGKPFVVNGQAVGETGKVNAFLDALTGVSLELAPRVLDATGTLTATIRAGNGSPVERTFTLNDPQPPVLYQRADDWSNQTLSIASENTLKIAGDNFRGLGTGATDRETVTRAYLIPVESPDPEADKIALPAIQDAFDYNIAPPIDELTGEDVLYQSVPANLFSVPEGETRRFRLRVENPDAGLSATSAPEVTVTFTP